VVSCDDFILPSSFWQAFFAPQEHPKIARSFNCGSTPPKNKAPLGLKISPLPSWNASFNLAA